MTNKNRISLILVYLLTSTIFFSGLASAKDSIFWMEAVAPPFFIHEGPLKRQGYEDLITDIIEESMPEYDHQRVRANISRHYQQWKQGEPACSLAMFKTEERKEFAYFSMPSVFTLPPVLIIKKDRFAEFGGEKTVSLQGILENGSLLIGRSTKRSYGAGFDNTLNKYGTADNIYAYEGTQLSLNLFKMLLSGRIDALPGLPEEAMYLAEKLGFREQVMTLSVEENIHDHEAMLTYVACSKTKWGEKVIREINKVLLEQRPTARYRAAYERWLDESSIEGYRKLYETIFLKIEK